MGMEFGLEQQQLHHQDSVGECGDLASVGDLPDDGLAVTSSLYSALLFAAHLR